MVIKLEGGKALMAWPLVEEPFFAASLIGWNIEWLFIVPVGEEGMVLVLVLVEHVGVGPRGQVRHSGDSHPLIIINIVLSSYYQEFETKLPLYEYVYGN